MLLENKFTFVSTILESVVQYTRYDWAAWTIFNWILLNIKMKISKALTQWPPCLNVIPVLCSIFNYAFQETSLISRRPFEKKSSINNLILTYKYRMCPNAHKDTEQCVSKKLQNKKIFLFICRRHLGFLKKYYILAFENTFNGCIGHWNIRLDNKTVFVRWPYKATYDITCQYNATILKPAIMINYSTNQVLLNHFVFKGCPWTKWYCSYFLLQNKPVPQKIVAKKKC